MKPKNTIPPLDGGTTIAVREDTTCGAALHGAVDGTPFHLVSAYGRFVFGAGADPESAPVVRLARSHFPPLQDMLRPSQAEMDRALAAGVNHYRQHRRHGYLIPQRTKVLWCVNVLGPDDIHAVEDFEQAVRLCNQLNTFHSLINQKHDIVLLAMVVPWPRSREEHAADLVETRRLFGLEDARS